MKLLRNTGLYFGHLLTALIGTAILTTPIWELRRPPAISGSLWQEIITGLICAAFLGFVSARISKDRLGVWTWVGILPFFMIHVLSTLSGGHQGSVLTPSYSLWARIFGFDCADQPSVGFCRNFFEFTVPLVRTAAYSLGAVIGFQVFVVSPKGGTAISPGRKAKESES